MKIHSMTATFGKLEHETLTLHPGLNVIQAPNEWGKSTWCAFLVAMLYGIETRSKSTKTTLADKQRYAPWSGSPMSGRIDLDWNGRNITIERRTKGRIPMGEFRAYETESGLPVPELNAANCGQMLLGVERSVFLRAGFVRFSDLPVTQDESLRSRLNALVTTGDESGAGDRLARELKELKNRCRYNRTGLLPQAEAERDALEAKCRELDAMEAQTQQAQNRLQELNHRIAQLENHAAALKYEAAQSDAGKISQAQAAADEAAGQLAEAEEACRELPPRDQAEWALSTLRGFQRQDQALQMESAMLQPPQEPEAPPEVFRGLTGPEAVAKAEKDMARHRELSKRKPLLLIIGALLLAIGGIVTLKFPVPGYIAAGVGVLLLVEAVIMRSLASRQVTALEKVYASDDPEKWVAAARSYADSRRNAQASLEQYRMMREDLEQRIRQHREKIQRCTQGQSLDEALVFWEGAVSSWNHWAGIQRDCIKAENYLNTLKSMAKTADKPEQPDSLTFTEEETLRHLANAAAERSLLQERLGQHKGRAEALGQRENLRAEIERLNTRIGKLEDTYIALTIAQEALADAARELQRRFAPRISQRAQELMGQFTGGRYNRLNLGQDFTLSAGAEGEDTLHDALWRSDGTIDQLYLALRLAVAEELTMDAPLVLDDALVRFDDDRLAAAMEVLRKEADKKQVILFTCQSREKNLEA